MMNLKKAAAQSAITFIKDKTTVGLGCGSTIKYMVDLLVPEVKSGFNIQLVTSSFSTHQLLLQSGLAAQPISNFSSIDIYFDGCDQFDKDLNAVKSGGGIHTREKLLASMARQFLLVGDDTKYAEQLDSKFPLVIEVLPEAYCYTSQCLQKLFPTAKIVIRVSDKNDGPAITGNGNYLFDVWFTAWPELKQINAAAKAITGVVETSLFYNLAHKAIIATSNEIKFFEKPVQY